MLLMETIFFYLSHWISKSRHRNPVSGNSAGGYCADPDRGISIEFRRKDGLKFLWIFYSRTERDARDELPGRVRRVMWLPVYRRSLSRPPERITSES